jgi:hypothetical protein
MRVAPYLLASLSSSSGFLFRMAASSSSSIQQITVKSVLRSAATRKRFSDINAVLKKDFAVQTIESAAGDDAAQESIQFERGQLKVDELACAAGTPFEEELQKRLKALQSVSTASSQSTVGGPLIGLWQPAVTTYR